MFFGPLIYSGFAGIFVDKKKPFECMGFLIGIGLVANMTAGWKLLSLGWNQCPVITPSSWFFVFGCLGHRLIEFNTLFRYIAFFSNPNIHP